MNRICVCGLGKLGSCVAAAFSASDIKVQGLDTDDAKVANINAGIAPVHEPNLQDYLDDEGYKRNLVATIRACDAVEGTSACLFVTATPSLPDGSFDHSYLLAALSDVAKEVKRQHHRGYLFVIVSTVVPGFTQHEAIPVVERHMGGVPFKIAYKPEFIALGTVLRDFLYPAVTLIGEKDEESGAAVEELYGQMLLQKAPVKRMSLVEAEMAKIALNSAVTMKISFANQVSMIACKMGADPEKILDAVGTDPRIGDLSLRPGLPFGGPCFPRDNRMFRHVASKVGEAAPLAEATDAVNRRVLRTVLDGVSRNGDVGILGTAYKPGTPIVDDSPGIWWSHSLRSSGRSVKTHDPLAPHSHKLEDVLACRTVIVACAWPEYETLDVPRGTLLLDPMGVVKRRPQAVEVA